jgi:gamma-glutamylcyclotransferase (GGCT)/AIG2-like uncharacterized protein YtfP
MTEMKFFVYGSMCEGLVHFSKIQNLIQESMNAEVVGTAYRLKVGYPVLLNQGCDLVPGQLITVNSSEFLLNLLDEFHGVNHFEPAKSLYFRLEKTVRLANGRETTAWTYMLNPEKLPATAAKIPGGDWKASLQQQPALTEKLTERQRNYILRLGSSSGREIVPIDLPLYRELMNLEMIVDKGRRLALSKLGHEVYRYLA